MRTALLMLISLLSMSLLAALWRLVLPGPLLVDIPLILVVHLAFAQRREQVILGLNPGPRGRLLGASDVVVVLGVGYVADLMAASPKGLHALALGIVYLVGRLARHRVDFSSVRRRVLLTFLASLLASSAISLASWAITRSFELRTLPMIGLNALVTAAMAAPFTRLFAMLDERLVRKPFGSTLLE
jgi:hypothetical protein